MRILQKHASLTIVYKYETLPRGLWVHENSTFWLTQAQQYELKTKENAGKMQLNLLNERLKESKH